MLGFNGGLIGKTRTTTLLAATGVWTPNEQSIAKRDNIWPIIVTGYRHIRWTITATRTDVTFQASEFNLTNGASNIDMSGSTVTPSSGAGGGAGGEIANIKDNNTATKWNTSFSGTPISAFFDMGSVTTFTGYRWATANDVSGRDPVSWTVSGSLDNITYVLLDTQTNFATTTDRQTYVGPFTFP